MKILLIKISALLLSVILILIALLYIPAPRYLNNGLYFSQLDKNDLLKKSPGPRLIFIGGSNLSLGLDCRMIKDSLPVNPINTSIHAGLGLKYMLRNTVKYVHENDVIIVSPEYQQFYGDLYEGRGALLFMLFNVSPDTKNLLDPVQCINLVKYIPEYCLYKFNPSAYFHQRKDTTTGIYDRLSFNAYGDAYKHWLLPKQVVQPLAIDGDLNNNVFELLKQFRKEVELKKAKLFLTFPCYQDVSFNQSTDKIKAVQRKLEENGFVLLGTPERYEVPDSLVFNTAYHLTGKGVKLRTKLLIADIEKCKGISFINPKPVKFDDPSFNRYLTRTETPKSLSPDKKL